MPRKKGTARAPGGLAFLVATDLVKSDADTRKFIRSHVMLGKNAGRILPPRQQKSRSKSTRKQSSPSEVPLEDMKIALSPASRRFGTRLSTLALADNVDPISVQSVLRFSSIAKQILFPLESCIFFENRAEEWIGPLTTDSAYLHCLIFTAQYFFDAQSSGRRGNDVPVNDRTISHFIKGLAILRQRMLDDNSSNELRLTNSTAAAVMGLSAHALVTEDLDFAKIHLEGLARIVFMRGGFSTFYNGSEKLLVEILRSDLGFALSSGDSPIFLAAVQRSPLFQFPDLTELLNSNGLPLVAALPESLSKLDDRLVDCWTVMLQFCTLINFAAATGTKVSTPIFLHVMTSTMYRLLSMCFDYDTFSEMLRLGLLAFCTSAFLQWRSLDMMYTRFITNYKRAMEPFLSSDAASDLKLWLVVVGRLSLLHPSDGAWLTPGLLYYTEDDRAATWTEMRSIMQNFMWIPLIHDNTSALVFRGIMNASDSMISDEG